MRSFGVEVRWDGAVVVGVSRVSPLRQETDVIVVHEGGTGVARALPGRDGTSTLTVERELGADLTLDLWASGPHLRKDVELGLRDPSDGLTVTFRLHGCWVSQYVVTADVSTGAVLESITLSVDRWERVTPRRRVLADQLAVQRQGEVRRIHLGGLLTGDVQQTRADLDVVLAQAQADGATLLLDEADALFGRRTDVRTTDRYASTEIDAVLDRLAQYDGSVVVVPPDEPPDDSPEP